MFGCLGAWVCGCLGARVVGKCVVVLWWCGFSCGCGRACGACDVGFVGLLGALWSIRRAECAPVLFLRFVNKRQPWTYPWTLPAGGEFCLEQRNDRFHLSDLRLSVVAANEGARTSKSSYRPTRIVLPTFIATKTNLEPPHMHKNASCNNITVPRTKKPTPTRRTRHEHKHRT